MANKLKPCPLCGGTPDIEYEIKGDYFETSIRCLGCFVSIRRCNYINGREIRDNPATILLKTEQDVVNAWNRRKQDG